ncbi:hypothetical protein A11G_0116480, partial [Xanthomonas vasicola pv. musacearum NCPPB 4392]
GAAACHCASTRVGGTRSCGAGSRLAVWGAAEVRGRGFWFALVVGEPRHIEGSCLRSVASDFRADESMLCRDLDAPLAASVFGA